MLNTDGTPVHFPTKPDKFEFDAEVAKIFPDMAARAIPNFHAAHAAHVGMAAGTLRRPGCRILDIGASRGHFYAHIKAAGFTDVEYVAVDNSSAMCEMLRADYPEAKVLDLDITSPAFSEYVAQEPFDIVCCNYVLQFLPTNMQVPVLFKLMASVKKSGFFFLGHKSAHYGGLGELQHEEYLKFRISKGYTREEIEAKTRALKGSMFPMRHDFVVQALRMTFSEVAETTRFMMFSTVAARK